MTGILASLIILRTRAHIIIFFAVLTSLILYNMGAFENFWMETLMPNKEMYEIATLKGRTYLWFGYSHLFKENPFLGNGFAVVPRLGSQFGIVDTTNAHNGFFEVVLGTGMLGAIFFLRWIVRLAKESLFIRNKRTLGSAGFIGGFTVIMVNNMGKSIVGGAFDPAFAVFALFLAFFIFQVRAVKTTQ